MIDLSLCDCLSYDWIVDSGGPLSEVSDGGGKIRVVLIDPRSNE